MNAASSAGVDLALKLKPLAVLVWGCCNPQAYTDAAACLSELQQALQAFLWASALRIHFTSFTHAIHCL